MIIMLSDFKDDDFFSGRIVESEIENKIEAGRVEAITFYGNNELRIGSKGIKLGSTEYPAKLFKMQITPIFRTVIPLSIISRPVVETKAGELYSYYVNASATPVAEYFLSEFPTGMSIDSATGLISWIPNIKGDYGVVVVASNGVSPDANQSFIISVQARDCSHYGDLCEQGTQLAVTGAERKDVMTKYTERPFCSGGSIWQQGTSLCVPK
jgi:hypothetical protein